MEKMLLCLALFSFVLLSNDLVQFNKSFEKYGSQLDSSTYKTVQTLGELGYYNEALELLSRESKKENAKSITGDVELLHFYNKMEDVNRKELNTDQKDSVDLLQRVLGGVGAHLYIPLHTNKSGVTLVPHFYFTNAVNKAGSEVTFSLFDSTLTIQDQFSFEKVVGKFYTDTLIEDGDSSFKTEENYKGLTYTPDSTDLISNILLVKYANLYEKVAFSAPVRWLYYFFRTNTPVLSSRSNISVDPSIQLFFRNPKGSLEIGANCFGEYQNFWGKGKVRDTLNSEHFTANYHDRLILSPQYNIDLANTKVELSFSGMILGEHFHKRKDEFDSFADEQNLNPMTSASLGVPLKNLWITHRISGQIDIRNWISYLGKVEYLTASEEYYYTAYEAKSENVSEGWLCRGTALDKKGWDLKVENSFPLKWNKIVTLSPLFIHEWREGDIYDSLSINSKMPSVYVPIFESQYLWETYQAYEPGVEIQLKKDKFLFKGRQTVRWEELGKSEFVQDSIYKRGDEMVYKSDIQGQWNPTETISLGINGIYSLRKGEEVREVNISSSFTLVKRFRFATGRR